VSSIKNHLVALLTETAEMWKDGHITEPDEYTAFKDLEIQIHEVKKVFERNKDIDIQ